MRPSSSREVEPLLTLPAVARYASVSVRTVRKWVRQGKLPATKPGRAYLVNRAEMVRALGEVR